MRGVYVSQRTLFVTKTVEDFVSPHHPLRSLRKLFDEAPLELDDYFSVMYSDIGRESIAPER